jgi:hypothetical protein
MKEMTSFYDDTEKRMGVFFGLGAFLLSSLFAFFQGLTPEMILLRGVAVLIVFSLLGWGFGAWLKRTIAATAPQEELPSNVERRSRNAESLDEGSLVILPGTPETEVMEAPATGSVVNFTLPEFTPMDMAAVSPPVNAENRAAPI